MDRVDADFRVFYRITGVGDGYIPEMSGPRFIRLCEQLPWYPGSVQMLVRTEHAKTDNGNQRTAGTGAPGRRSTPAEGVVDVPATVAPIHRGFAGDGQMYPPVFDIQRAPPKS